jgi:hypothetical protein
MLFCVEEFTGASDAKSFEATSLDLAMPPIGQINFTATLQDRHFLAQLHSRIGGRRFA